VRRDIFFTGIFWLAAMACLSACAPRLAPPTRIYYVTPPVTYLRDSPTYEAGEVAPIYLADQVERLENEQNGWWQVRSVANQQVGWMDGRLLSPDPVPVATYYAAQSGLPLRDFPGTDGPSRKRLAQGDELLQIDQDERGWTRVIVAKDKGIGWVETAALSPVAPAPIEAAPQVKKPEGKAILFVAVPTLNLRSLPLASSEVVRVLKLNEQVEKLATHQRDWLKVRYPETGSEGWAASRFLKDSPVQEKVRPARKIRRPRTPTPPKDADHNRAPTKPEIM
jgi:uncharacterized protein YgiM (DUF1202 family)